MVFIHALGRSPGSLLTHFLTLRRLCKVLHNSCAMDSSTACNEKPAERRLWTQLCAVRLSAAFSIRRRMNTAGLLFIVTARSSSGANKIMAA